MTDWTDPTTEEVAPGVFRIPLPLPNDGLKAVNVYALVGDDGALTLVDAGWSIPDARRLLIEALGRLDCTPADIRRFLVTHIHRDHYTMAVALRRDFGSTVCLGAGEESSLQEAMGTDRRPLQHHLELLRRLGAKALADSMAAELLGHRVDRSDWELPDEWLAPGTLDVDAKRRVDVVPTPGHTQGHVVYHDVDAALLFAGDHVLPTITPSIGFEPVPSANPLGDFLASLALVRARPDAKLLPAHGAVTDSVHARVDELVAHHGARLDETEAGLRHGGTTAYDVAGQLRWTRRGRSLDELDPFNQMLAIAETDAHLRLLAAQGRIHSADDDGVRRYSLA